MKVTLTIIAALILVLAAPAMAASLALTNAPATDGPGKFAAEEIRREAAERGTTMGEDAQGTREACAQALFDASSDKFEHAAALRHLAVALTHWKKYAAIRGAHYIPALYNRVGFVDVTALTEKVAADLELARTWKPDTLKDDVSLERAHIVDSVRTLELIMFIEETFGFSVDNDDAVPENFDTVSAIVAYVERKRGA